MTWSYDETNLGTSTTAQRRNSVRLLLQDTSNDDQLVQNEEIEFWLSQAGDDIYGAAAAACEALSAKYARLVDTAIDGTAIEVKWSENVTAYQEMARRFRTQALKVGAGLGAPRAGGISRSDMESVYDLTDRVDPGFKHRQFSNPPFDNDDSEEYDR